MKLLITYLGVDIMNHKIFKTLLVLVVAMMTFFAEAETVTVDGIDWNYSVEDGKASVCHRYKNGYPYPSIPKSTSGAITIPSTLGGYPVTSIGKWAFEGCSSLTSVTIPDGVTSIGSSAFGGCSSLMRVTIPNSVTSIGDRALYGCRSLTNVTIPNGVTDIGSHAFQYCTSLTSVTIPNSVTSIGWSAFSGCSSLTSVTIPNSVQHIGICAFEECGELTFYTDNGNGSRLREMLELTYANIREIIEPEGDSLSWRLILVCASAIVLVVGGIFVWIVFRKKKNEGPIDKSDCSIEVANVSDTVEELNENVCPQKGKWWIPSGRATRSMWWLSRLVLVFSLILGVIALSSIRESYFENMLFIFSIIIICITVYMCIIVDIKRLHDMNLSGWTLLLVYFLQLMLLLVQHLVYIPFLVLIVDLYFLIVFGFLDGIRGPNRYGEDPKDRV